MNTLLTHSTRVALAGVTAVALAGSLAACSSNDPLAGGGGDGDSGDTKTLIIGSQGTGEGEILAEIYGQVLAANGYDISYEVGIGSCETYIPALKDGSIDMIPDYSGNLLLYLDKENTARSPEDIDAALPAALEPEGLAALDSAPGQDSDSLVVTPEFAAEHNVATIADLAQFGADLKIGANSEFEERWRDELIAAYGLGDYAFTPIEDYGGPDTLSALLDGTVDAADIYSTTPSIGANDLVALEDPEFVIPASSIVPILSADFATDEVADLLNPVSAKITTKGLLELNTKYNGDDKPSAASLATQWLKDNGFDV